MKKKIETIFAVPHFHFDVEWWKTDDLYAEDANEILSKTLELLDKYPEFTYAIDQVLAVRPFWHKNPQKREKLLNYIKDGRIELVGGTFCAPDENIPTGEALVRQFIYGKKFLCDVLGGNLYTGWEIDEFGHPSQIPQIVAKCGLNYFVFARGVIPYEGDHPINFYWEAPDGTKVLTYWFASHYAGMMPIKDGVINKILFKNELKGRINYEGSRSQCSALLIPFGSDFTIPSEEWIKFVKEWNSKEKVKVKFSLPHKFFEFVENELFDKEIPVRRNEYNPILTGCYESREKIKKYCRNLQNRILSVEKLNTIAYLLGAEYPHTEIDIAWEKILENDFHDIVCGTGTDKVYRNAIKRYEEAEKIIDKLEEQSLEFISSNIDTESAALPLTETDNPESTDKESTIPFIVFNTLNWDRKDIVKLSKKFSTNASKDYTIYDDCFNPVLTQETADGEIIFTADIPQMGYRTFYLVQSSSSSSLSSSSSSNSNNSSNSKNSKNPMPYAQNLQPSAFSPSVPDSSDLLVSENILENKYYRVEIDSTTGCIEQILDKTTGENILDTNGFKGNEIVVEEDVGNLWTIQKTGKLWRQSEYTADNIKVLETGPVRAALEVRGKHKESYRIQKIILYADSEKIEFETVIDFKGKDKRFKVMFNPNLKSEGKAFFETPYCADMRGDGHWCAQNWVDMSDGRNGLAVINSGNPGYEVSGNTLSMTLFRSVSIFTPQLINFVIKNFPEILRSIGKGLNHVLKGLNIYEWALYKYHGLTLREWASEGGPPVKGGISIFDHLIPWVNIYKESQAWERGRHKFSYAIYPHKENFRTIKLPRIGYEFNNSLIVHFPIRPTNQSDQQTNQTNRPITSTIPAETENYSQTEVKTSNSSKSKLPKKYSFLQIKDDCENIILTVFKKAEKEEAVVLRFYDSLGQSTNAEVNFSKFEILSAEKIAFTEDVKISDVEKTENSFSDEIGKWEIAAYKVCLAVSQQKYFDLSAPACAVLQHADRCVHTQADPKWQEEYF